MAHSFALPSALRSLPPASRLVFGLLALALLVLAGRALIAQVAGERGIAPVASSTDIEVTGIEVDAEGDTAEEARQAGWLQAQRKAWERLEGPDISDSQLQSMVTAVVVEREQIGPRRYIATLGVIFDRQRASRYFGEGGQTSRSAPLLLVPVTFSGGTATVYQMRNPWQRAWAEFQPGQSRIDYVRPVGAGGDSLLVTYGQTGRRSRTWWRAVLDQFGAADVIVAIANLRYRYPGGPVEGTFTARYGPDNRYLDSFTLTAANPDQLPDMLEQAVERFDGIFERALVQGVLRPDPTLNLDTPELSPALQRLIEMGRQAQAQDRAAAEEQADSSDDTSVNSAPEPAQQPQVVNSFTVQFTSPDAAAIDATLAAVRAVAGVRGAATSSIAIGGTSVMTVSFGGDLSALAAALRGRGFSVNQGPNALSISR